MPIRSTSRYAGLPVYDATDARQVEHPTVAIRPPVPPPPGAALYQHTVSGAENLEYLAFRYFGSSDAWWRIAESNPLVFPLDFTPGDTVAIAPPGDAGRVVRSRRF